MQSEIDALILEKVFPQLLDIEIAKRKIIDFMKDSPPQHLISAAELINHIKHQMFPDPGPSIPGYEMIDPDIDQFRGELAIREAIQLLTSNGLLVSFGQITDPDGPVSKIFSGSNSRYTGPIGTVRIPIPSVHVSYKISTLYRGNFSRLSNCDIYLSHLDKSFISERIQNYLREAVKAFQAGLFISVVQSLGAASEGLWLALGRQVLLKDSTNKKLNDELKDGSFPRIGSVMYHSWLSLTNALKSKYLEQALPAPSEQSAFRKFADELREWRNDATHSATITSDPQKFSYSETGLLLIDGSDYFNQLTSLIKILT